MRRYDGALGVPSGTHGLGTIGDGDSLDPACELERSRRCYVCILRPGGRGVNSPRGAGSYFLPTVGTVRL
jgi:hypothetical protein